uniref:Asparagine synthetase [glutamine-hydrolyzing] n=1 Tax=Strigamia maritima TaxID=126957 RepID=T1JD29_STRMM
MDDFFGDIFSQYDDLSTLDNNASASTPKTDSNTLPSFLRGNGEQIDNDINIDFDLPHWNSLHEKNKFETTSASDEPNNTTESDSSNELELLSESFSFTKEKDVEKVQRLPFTTNQSPNLKRKDTSGFERQKIYEDSSFRKYSLNENDSVSSDTKIFSTTKKRKFPGPAGLLQRLPPNHIRKLSKVPFKKTEEITNAASQIEIPCTQIDESEFFNGPWLQASRDLRLDEFLPLLKYNISWLLEKTSQKQLPNNKMPVLIAIIKTINIPVNKAYGLTILKDETGEIAGTIQDEVMDQYVSILKAGTVLVLQQVHVYSTSIKEHLIITPINIARIYFSHENNSVGCLQLIKCDFADMVKHSEAVAIENQMRSVSPVNLDNIVKKIKVQRLKTVKSPVVNLQKSPVAILQKTQNLNFSKTNEFNDIDWGDDDLDEIINYTYNMCGIWAVFGRDDDILQYFVIAYNQIHHRGPDAWRIENDRKFKHSNLGFHRLSIVDDMFGMQPMRIKSLPNLWLLCNGEIYNCDLLRDQFVFTYETRCDVEAILHLYAKGGIDFCVSHLDGVFAFCLLDVEKRKVFLARDTFGVRPAFSLLSENGFLAVCSEAKGLMDLIKGLNCKGKLQPLAPGCYEEYDLKESDRATFVKKVRFHQVGQMPQHTSLVPWSDLEFSTVKDNIRRLLTAAVRKRLMAHRRIGCLLSGGLDSSLVAALLVKLAKEKRLAYTVQTFSIGMEGSPDVLAARKVAAHIKSDHHEVLFTPEDAFNVVDKVIYHLECYDITTIRASIGMYLVSQYIITKSDSTVILSGEGADEVAQGYIYFRDAPSAKEGHEESMRLLKDLYFFDVLRGDRTTAAHGLEIRVPFLDHQFTSYYLQIPAELRQPQDRVEKHLLRSAFDGIDILPNEILWRHKEAFSDGVTTSKKSLFNYLQESIEPLVSDDAFAKAKELYQVNTPQTKEAFYYRQVFERHFPDQAALTPYYWMPKWTTCKDPSARLISHYNAD